MKTVIVTTKMPEFPKGNYARHVIENGHKPGVLSGAELKGKAKKYGGWYARKREEVQSFLAQYYCVRAETIYDFNRSRWVKVWIDGRTGVLFPPVKVEVHDE